MLAEAAATLAMHTPIFQLILQTSLSVYLATAVHTQKGHDQTGRNRGTCQRLVQTQ